MYTYTYITFIICICEVDGSKPAREQASEQVQERDGVDGPEQSTQNQDTH